MNMSGFRTSDGMEFGPMNVIPVSVEGDPERPAAFTLHQNYPNPFNPSTVIRYSIPDAAGVKLIVYDITGREVATLVNQSQQAGLYTLQFDGTNLASGVYIYLLQTDGIARQTRKMILLK